MASINRYTQNVQPRYNPMSLQEIIMAPAYKRQQHDLMSESIAGLETQLAQVDPLDIHSDLAKQEQQKLYDELAKQSELLTKEGFTNTTKGDILRLNKQYQQNISPTGTLGKINAAKIALSKEKEAYIQNATKMGYSPEQAGFNWDNHVSNYAKEFDKTGRISNIGSLYAPKYHDVISEAKDLFTKAGFSQETLYNDLGTGDIEQDEKGTYVLTTKGYEKYGSNASQLEAALNYMNNQIMNTNSEVYKSLIHQGKTPESALQEIDGLNDVFLKNSLDKASGKTITNFTAAQNLGIPMDGNLQYEAKDAETIKTTSKSLVKSLNNIINGIKYEAYGSPYRPSEVAGPNKEGGVSTFENSLKGKEKEEYNKIYEGLSKVNPQLLEFDQYSNEAANIIKNYIQSNQNVLRQDLIITDDFITDYGDRSVGVSKTNNTKIIDAIKAERDYRTYSINGEVYTYNELPSDIKKKENFDKLIYSGYYSPKNFNTDKYGSVNNKKLFVSPIVMKHIDDNGDVTEILVSRSQSEMEAPAFKADMLFNDIFVNTNKYPGLPYNISGTSDEIIYYPEGVPIPGAPSDAKYIVNKKNDNGSYNIPVFLTESDLQNKLYAAYNVKQSKD